VVDKHSRSLSCYTVSKGQLNHIYLKNYRHRKVLFLAEKIHGNAANISQEM